MTTQNNSSEINEKRKHLKKLLFLVKNQKLTVANIEQELKASAELLDNIKKEIVETVRELKKLDSNFPSEIRVKMPDNQVIDIDIKNGYQGVYFTNDIILNINEVDQ